MKNPINEIFGSFQVAAILSCMVPLVGVKSFLKQRTNIDKTRKQLIPNEMKLVKASLPRARGKDRGNRHKKENKVAQRHLPPHVSPLKASGKVAPSFSIVYGHNSLNYSNER